MVGHAQFSLSHGPSLLAEGPRPSEARHGEAGGRYWPRGPGRAKLERAKVSITACVVPGHGQILQFAPHGRVAIDVPAEVPPGIFCVVGRKRKGTDCAKDEEQTHGNKGECRDRTLCQPPGDCEGRGKANSQGDEKGETDSGAEFFAVRGTPWAVANVESGAVSGPGSGYWWPTGPDPPESRTATRQWHWSLWTVPGGRRPATRFPSQWRRRPVLATGRRSMPCRAGPRCWSGVLCGPCRNQASRRGAVQALEEAGLNSSWCVFLRAD